MVIGSAKPIFLGRGRDATGLRCQTSSVTASDGVAKTTVEPNGDDDAGAVVGTSTPAAVIEGWAELFQALSDTNRLKILLAVHYSPRINVGDLAAAVGMGANATSHALAALRVRGIVRSERVGRERRWSIASERIHSLLHDVGAEHPPQQSPD